MKLGLSIVGLLILFTTALAQSVRSTRMPEDVFIYAVSRDMNPAKTPDKDFFVIEPIVWVHYGKDPKNPTLKEAVVGDNPLDSDRLEAFYKQGNRVSVFRGGARLGEAMTIGSEIDGREAPCRDLEGALSYRVSGEEPLLATTTTTEIPGHRPTRRPATAAEVSIFRRLAIESMRDYGLDRDLLQKGTLGPVLSTELHSSNRRALIGRFDVASKTAIHHLFAVAEQNKTGSGYLLTLTSTQVQLDLKSEKDQVERAYLDQLDVDNDGQDDIITVDSLYESTRYSIWEYRDYDDSWSERGSWRGSGC
jgi:hypothetical protein